MQLCALLYTMQTSPEAVTAASVGRSSLSCFPARLQILMSQGSVKGGEQQGVGDLYTSLKANSLRHSSRMPSSSASPMPPYALGSALSLLMWPASARPNADARRLASAQGVHLQFGGRGGGGMGGRGVRRHDQGGP